MYSDATILEFIDLIGEAALDPTRWIACLQKLAHTLNVPWCFFFVHDYAHNAVDIRAAVGFAASEMKSYEDYYAAKNPALITGRKLLWPGNVCTSSELCPDDVFFKSEFFNEWAAPQRIGHGVAATVLKTPTQVGLFGALQRIGAHSVDEAGMRLLRQLMPHLDRAVRTHTTIVRLQQREKAHRDALNQSHQAIILLDAHGRVVSTNRAADDLLRRRNGLSLDLHHHLVARRPDETATLRALIREALGLSAFTHPGGMPLTRSGSHRPLELSVMPLASSPAVLHESQAACMILISDPDDDAGGDEHLLRRLYGLTPTEAKVAVRLARGMDLPHIADDLGQGLETTRSHLKKVLSKTGTRRQAELVRLVLRGPASLRIR